jgi:nicotinamide N-methyltransferase
MEADNRPKGSDSDGDDDGTSTGLDMFREPDDFRPPTPPATEAFYELADPNDSGRTQRITLSLVGSHPLWGHHLWNAAPTMSEYLRKHAVDLCQGKNILELGAAAGLPSIVAHRLGAQTVVTTDYPDADLVGNLQKNVDTNRSSEARKIVSQGYIWGHDVEKLIRHLPTTCAAQKFDLLLLSDLIFNHQAHTAMLETMDMCLPAADKIVAEHSLNRPQALVFFTHHRPHLAQKDMAFFELSQQKGWTCEELGSWKMDPMFPDDPGSEEVRATVHGWSIFR